MELDCISHLALLRTEYAYSNKIDTDKVIDEFASRKGCSKFFLTIFLNFESYEKSRLVNSTLTKVKRSLSYY